MRVQGKIEIKILEMLKDDDPEEKRNVVCIRDSFTYHTHHHITFTFRNHVVSNLLGIYTYLLLYLIVHQL